MKNNMWNKKKNNKKQIEINNKKGERLEKIYKDWMRIEKRDNNI